MNGKDVYIFGSVDPKELNAGINGVSLVFLWGLIRQNYILGGFVDIDEAELKVNNGRTRIPWCRVTLAQFAKINSRV